MIFLTICLHPPIVITTHDSCETFSISVRLGNLKFRVFERTQKTSGRGRNWPTMGGIEFFSWFFHESSWSLYCSIHFNPIGSMYGIFTYICKIDFFHGKCRLLHLTSHGSVIGIVVCILQFRRPNFIMFWGVANRPTWPKCCPSVIFTGWWFQIHFIFTSKIGEMICQLD